MAEEKVKKSFFKDMKKELKKVIWPTKKQTVKNTLVVIAIVIIVAVVTIVLDEVFISANNLVMDKVTGGEITETKNLSNAMEELKKLHDQGLIDDQTYSNYYMYAAYGLVDSASLNKIIDDIKNGTTQESNQVEANTEAESNAQATSAQ